MKQILIVKLFIKEESFRLEAFGSEASARILFYLWRVVNLHYHLPPILSFSCSLLLSLPSLIFLLSQTHLEEDRVEFWYKEGWYSQFPKELDKSWTDSFKALTFFLKFE